MVKGDMKKMSDRYIRAHSLLGYGVSMAVGVGIPVPVLNAEMARFTGVSNEDILMPVKDYSRDYQNLNPRIIKHVSYAELVSGSIEIDGKKVETHPLTSYHRSLEIAVELKKWIEKGDFLLTEPVETIESC